MLKDRLSHSAGTFRMTKEQDFKRRFATVLQDLQQEGSKDNQTMYLLGSLASDLSDDLKRKNWTEAKQVITPALYDQLLKKFEHEGSEHHAAGRTTHAYVIQALAVSLIAGTQRKDPQLREGEQLLDARINHAIAFYRAQPKPN
jgi:hypothetical protein